MRQALASLVGRVLFAAVVVLAALGGSAEAQDCWPLEMMITRRLPIQHRPDGNTILPWRIEGGTFCWPHPLPFHEVMCWTLRYHVRPNTMECRPANEGIEA